MSPSPATPDKAGKDSPGSPPNVLMTSTEKLTSAAKVRQASINEPSPASTYGDTAAGSSYPATPQNVHGYGLTESMRAAQIDTAIQSISGSPMSKGLSKVDGNAISRVASDKSSPSSSRLVNSYGDPNWRNQHGAIFIRQSSIQSDDPFISNASPQSPGQGGASFVHRHDRPNVPLTNETAQALLPPSACVFVANLMQTQADDQLEYHVRNEFQRFGNCYVKIRRDRNGMPFAFVQFETEADSQRAIRDGRGMVITGRPCRTEQARANRALYLSRVDGAHISEEEAHKALARYGPIAKTWYCSMTDKEMYRLPEGIWVSFDFFQDCRDAQAGFRDHVVYRLEQPPQLEDILARQMGRQNLNMASPIRRSPAQRGSAGRTLPPPLRGATDQCAIFVGQLPPSATKEQLLQMFQIYGVIVHIELVQKPSINVYGVNTFAFIEYRSQEMVLAAILGSPRVYGTDLIRVERKVSLDPFAHRDVSSIPSGGSPRAQYYGSPYDMTTLYQRGVYAGMAQATQTHAMPPAVYAPYPYYQPYDPSQYSQITAQATHGDNAMAANFQPQGNLSIASMPGQFSHAIQPQAQANAQAAQVQAHAQAPAMVHYQYATQAPPATTYMQYPQQPARGTYQWPPANAGNEDVNASPSR